MIVAAVMAIIFVVFVLLTTLAAGFHMPKMYAVCKYGTGIFAMLGMVSTALIDCVKIKD